MSLVKSKKYKCDSCENEFNWSEDSRWYGSYKMQETKPELIKHYCSVKCARKTIH